MKEITDREFTELVQFIKRNFGIDLSQKRSLVQGRLHNYMIQCGFDSFSSYFHYLVSDKTDQAGTVLVNKLTTNHTYFMREPQHFEFLEKVILADLVKGVKKEKDLRIWSAGCSSGEEPYTLAMIIDSFLGLEKCQWDTKILATDISAAVLERAQKGIYPSNQLTTVPSSWRSKYFHRIDDENSVIHEKIRQEVIFRRFNLMNAAFPFKKKFHLILCRNVMIYFDSDTRRELVNRFYNHMEPGGYLFIGHSESLNRNDSKYSFVAPAIYRRE
jgi:chemotaxis protein methyltransferase CheR